MPMWRKGKPRQAASHVCQIFLVHDSTADVKKSVQIFKLKSEDYYETGEMSWKENPPGF